MRNNHLTSARIFFAVAITTGSVWAQSAHAQPPFPGAMRLIQSEPTTVNDATFAAVVQARWHRPEKAMEHGFLSVTQVDLQFFVTNHKKANVAFSRTFGVKLFDMDGKEVAVRRKQKDTIATGPIVLPEGGSYAVYHRADLSLSGNAVEFSFFDAGGRQSIFGPLQTGRYKLGCSNAVSAEQAAKFKVEGAEIWTGEVVMKDVTVYVLPDIIRGNPRFDIWDDDYRRPGTTATWVAASKPVLNNDARFTVVAQRDWKCGKDEKESVPIDIQFHITNVGKKDLIFGTFDAFHIFLKDSNGKKLKGGGGRDGTRFTKPLWIPAGATYSICRKAELGWDKEAKCPILNYWDGTGSVTWFSPLSLAAYDVSFGYWGRPYFNIKELDPKRRQGDPELWAGSLVTDNARVQLQAP